MSPVSISDEMLSHGELGRMTGLIRAALGSGVSHLTLIEEYTGTTNLTQYFDFLLQDLVFEDNSVSINVLDEMEVRQSKQQQLLVSLVPGYRGKADIVAAIKDMAKTRSDDPEQDLGETLLVGKLPEPDLMVFFDGRKVLGEAGVWIGAYSEFAFLQQSWQSFTAGDLDGLLEDYGMRERRFGAVRSGAK